MHYLRQGPVNSRAENASTIVAMVFTPILNVQKGAYAAWREARMSSKKGDNTMEIIGGIIIVLFIVFLYMSFTGRSFAQLFGATSHVEDTLIEDTLEKCREQTGIDFDDDGLPDFCDNCPLVSNNEPDMDNDLFPIGCCGNDGRYNFLIDPKKEQVEANYKDPGWCSRPEKDEMTEKPPHPSYNVAWR